MRGMTRRDWLRTTAGAAAGGLLAARAQSAPRPNFLFVNIDDLAWNAMGFEGRFPFLKTPNIDRLAREGMKFENAFVTISLCSPSRACSLTGCHAHRHDVRVNEAYDPHPDLPTYPQLLQEAGYATAHIGKWHMQPTAEPRPGFDYWLSFRGQGVYRDPELNENGRDFQAEGYMTDLLSDYAVKWLKQPRTAPFCLNLWHKAVHGPFTPPPRHAEDFTGESLDEPPNWEDDFADKPAWIRRGMQYGIRQEKWRDSEGKPIPERIPPYPWNGADENHLNYLRLITAIDEGLGRVFDALEETGQIDNTCIVFTSDNGYFLGEHRRGDKRLAYEESMRIPMVVWWPGHVAPGTVREEMVLNIDVAPTLLELAGVRVPKVMQGRSMAPLLRGGRPDWRQSFLYEYFEEGWLPGIPTILAVRTPRWKYITFPERPEEGEELYDLVHDAIEMRNLASDPAHADTLDRMRRELARLKRATGFNDEVPPRVKVPLEKVFGYDMADLDGHRLPASSGEGWDAKLVKGAPRHSNDGLRFTGAELIQVEPVPKSFEGGAKPFSVRVRLAPEAPDGVALSLGGQSHGFSVYLKGGMPHFALRSSGSLAVVSGKEALPMGKSTEITAVVTGHPKLRLFVDGKRAGEAKSHGFLFARPNEGLSIGGDPATAVGEYAGDAVWRGLIEEAAFYWGELRD